MALYRLAISASEAAESICTIVQNQPRFLAIGLNGVWGWRGKVGIETGADGELQTVKGAIQDFDRIAWQGRTVYILFDSDKKRNPLIQAAERELAKELKSRGAIVKIIDLPDLPDLGKTGCDNFLAHPEGGPARMLELIEAARLREPPIINAADQDLDRATKAAWDALRAANKPEYMFLHGGQRGLNLTKPERRFSGI